MATDSIIMPESIEYEFYKQFLELVIDRQRRRSDGENVPALRLYCRSNGGGSRDGFGVVSAIRMDGNVEGIMLGETISTGATIWAACQFRVVHPLARMGIHPVAWFGAEGIHDAKRIGAIAEEFAWTDQEQCRIYAAASKKSFKWWWKRYTNTAKLFWLDAKQLRKIGMAEVWQHGTE